MTPKRSALIAGLLAIVLVVAAVVATTRTRSSKDVASVVGAAGVTGPQAVKPSPGYGPLPSFAAATAWDNSAPLTPARLRGKVVLVDFWTASCINCRRTFDFLRTLQRTYGPRGLVIVGVHSPEFGFERSHAYVARSVGELHVTWPVAEDPDMSIWNTYGNQYWPANYLADRAGNVRYTHVGEGDEQQIEGAVRTLLAEGGSAGSSVVGPLPERQSQGAANENVTPETYLGSARATGDGRVALRGATRSAQWLSAPVGATVTLTERAKDVYALVGPETTGPVVVDVTLAGKPVPVAARGPDLAQNAAGRTVLTVGAQDLLHVLSNTAVADGTLAFRPVSRSLRMYTFTFGG